MSFRSTLFIALFTCSIFATTQTSVYTSIEDVPLPYATATHLSSYDASEGIYAIYADNIRIGYAMDTQALPAPLEGYADVVHLYVFATSHTAEAYIVLQEHWETPRYMRRVLNHETWREALRSPVAQLARRGEVDTVSGATFTADAIQDTLTRAAQTLMPYLEKLNATETTSEEDADAVTPHIPIASRTGRHRRGITDRSFLILISVYALALVCHLTRLFRFTWVRWTFRLLSIFLLGFVTYAYFSFEHIGRIMHGHFPPVTNLVFYTVVLFALISPFFLGRFYCRWLCPFGVASDVCYAVVPVSWRIPPRIMKHLRWIKFIIFVAVLVTLFFMPHFDASRAEPFQGIFSPVRDGVALIAAIAILIVSCGIQRVWCTVFCLDGALFELLTRIRSSLFIFAQKKER